MANGDEAGSVASIDALKERVDNQGRSIRALAEETSAQFRDFRAETTRTSSELGNAIKAIDAKLDANSKSVAEQGRPQYLALFGAVVGAIGVAVTITQWQSSLRDTPINDKIATQGTQISELTKAIQAGLVDLAKNTVSEKEFAQTIDFTNRISDLKSTEAEKRRVVMQAQVDRLQDGLVTRQEHQFHWTGQEKFEAQVTQELQAVNRRLDDLAPASDTIKRLSDREHELELRLFASPPPPIR